MIVRDRDSLKIPKKYLFNAGIAVIGLAMTTFVIREAFIPKATPACADRYGRISLFSWKHGDGRLLSPSDLQAKLRGKDWGVLENVRFSKSDDLQFGAQMIVRLDKDQDGGAEERRRSGTGFVWSPSFLKTADAACLAYSVKLPKNFDFGQGGSLPGLYGGGDDAAETFSDKGSNTFSTRMRWLNKGKVEVRLKSPTNPAGVGFGIDEENLRLVTGRWVNIEQEVVLNSPGKTDGIIRVWVDGNLKYENTRFAFRTKADMGLKGVVAGIHYAGPNFEWRPAAKSSAIAVSPFYVRLQ